MANASFHLFQLQKIDLRFDQVTARSKKVADQISDNQKLSEAESAVTKIKIFLHQKNTELKQAEDSAQAKRIKIEQSESALYKGTNKSPKELHDLQLEVAALKRSLSAIEENQLNIMAEIEVITDQLQVAEQQYNTVFSDCESTNKVLFVELDGFKKELEILQAERVVALGQTSSDQIAIYEKLRLSKNHIAVTGVEDQCCSTCGSELTASDIQKARTSTAISFCLSCGRILYAG